MKYQVTFYNEGNHYKPVATTIEAKSRVEIVNGKWKEAMSKICIKRGWTPKEMTEIYKYNSWKCRKAE